MVFSGGVSDWVAFADTDDNGFETIVRSTNETSHSHSKDSKGTSARGRGSDSSSVSSWMKQPVNSDASWAPVAPPKTTVASPEHPVASKRRPPRTRPSSSHADFSAISRRSNPVSSSDSSTSSVDRPPRGRTEELSGIALPLGSSKIRDSGAVSSTSRGSHRERSRSRSRAPELTQNGVVSVGSAHSRGRSSSRARSSKTRDRSSSTARRGAASTKGSITRASGSRTGSRPPPTSSNRHDRSRTSGTRSRSTSRPRPSKPPPATSRTRRETRMTISSSSSVGPGIRGGNRMSSSRSVASEDGFGSLRSVPDINIGRDISFGRTSGARPPPSPLSSGKPRSGIMEKLFGDQVSEAARQSYLPRVEPSPKCGGSVSTVSWQQPEQTHSRILLTATVYHNTATNLWIATINTNQKGVAKNPKTASKYLKAFSFTSEKEARESAIANAPPKMLQFGDHPNCSICKGKFAMFRRASHCRNCGVCVCATCSVTWPAKMIPDTYNLKKESQVRICKSCNHLSCSFKKALLDGDYEEAIALYGSGNINLRTPFPQQSKKKDETMYPIHCAVEGGNLEIVRWLVEDHFCPMKVIRTGKTPKRGGSADQLILTSKNRSVLTIAMTSLHVDIMRYLVVDNGVSIYDSKDLTSSLRALEAVLLALPKCSGNRQVDSVTPRWDDRSFDDHSFASSLGADQTVGGDTFASSKKKSGTDSCIICYENSINCVMTPCGHQVCCLECSKNLSLCPVCNNKGEFIKIFRP